MRVLPAPWPSPSPLRAHRQSRMGRTNRADNDDVAKISMTTTTTATALFLEAAAAAAAGSTIGKREQNNDAGLVFILCGTFWMKKKLALVLIYGSVESYRFICRKKTVGVVFRILSERSLQLK